MSKLKIYIKDKSAEFNDINEANEWCIDTLKKVYGKDRPSMFASLSGVIEMYPYHTEACKRGIKIPGVRYNDEITEVIVQVLEL